MSSSACPENIREAYKARFESLQPDENTGCLELARRELYAVRSARDSMMGFVNLNLAMGGTCDPLERSHSPTSDAWTRLEEMGGVHQPVLLSAWRTARRWLTRSVHSLRATLVKYCPFLVMLGAVAIQASAMVGFV